jgi:hypothetical protein
VPFCLRRARLDRVRSILLFVACSTAPVARVDIQPLPSVTVRTQSPEPGCTEDIPNTTVCDTPRARAVIDFCERYRHAVEDRDVSTLVALASPRYREDQIDYAALKDFLTQKMAGVSAIRYEAKYRAVTFRPDGMVAVDYQYSASYRMPHPSGDQWHHSIADNTLVLEPHGASFLIVRGM